MTEYWRVGTKLGRTIYRHCGPNDHEGELMGLIDDAHTARRIVDALNDQVRSSSTDEGGTDGVMYGIRPHLPRTPDQARRDREAAREFERLRPLDTSWLDND